MKSRFEKYRSRNFLYLLNGQTFKGPETARYHAGISGLAIGKYFFLDNPLILNYLASFIIIMPKNSSVAQPRLWRGRSGRVPLKAGLIPPEAGL
jgi:hypothetical protein